MQFLKCVPIAHVIRMVHQINCKSMMIYNCFKEIQLKVVDICALFACLPSINISHGGLDLHFILVDCSFVYNFCVHCTSDCNNFVIGICWLFCECLIVSLLAMLLQLLETHNALTNINMWVCEFNFNVIAFPSCWLLQKNSN
jgi:hypothetical protein